MTGPSFSVIVPTFQRRDIVLETVSALAELNYQGDVEIVVVVDGSTDGTAEALAHLRCKVRLHIVEQQNGGLAAARNRGAAVASKDILLFLDDDMTPAPDMLEEHAGRYREGADAVVGMFTEPVLFTSVPYQSEPKPGGLVTSAFEVLGGHLSVRADAFRAVGGFDQSFTANGSYGYEDFDFGQRLLQRFVVRQSRKPVSHHRKHVTPREFVRRARTCAKNEVYLATKHPHLRRELLDWTGAAHIGKRLQLLAKVPLLLPLCADVASYVAQFASHTPLRETRAFRFICRAAYRIAYVAAVERNGGIAALERVGVQT
jgi:glycosyltransferase involved in cell wall biosynthesis